MAKIEILVKGYVIKEEGGERANSTAVLVQEKDINIIVDPGLARQPLAEGLAKANLKPEDRKSREFVKNRLKVEAISRG